MAVVKKTVAPVAAAKVEAPKAEVKKAAPTTPVKTETKTAVKEAEKAPVAKAEEKAPVKAEVKKPAAKKETVKKETKKAAPAKAEAPAKAPAAKKETAPAPAAPAKETPAPAPEKTGEAKKATPEVKSAPATAPAAPAPKAPSAPAASAAPAAPAAPAKNPRTYNIPQNLRATMTQQPRPAAPARDGYAPRNDRFDRTPGGARPAYGTQTPGQRPAYGAQNPSTRPAYGSQNPAGRPAYGSAPGARPYGQQGQRPGYGQPGGNRPNQNRGGGGFRDKDEGGGPRVPREKFQPQIIVRGQTPKGGDGAQKQRGTRVVDMRGDNVDLTKYDERLDTFVPDAVRDMRGGNQRLRKQQVGTHAMTAGRKGAHKAAAPATKQATRVQLPENITVSEFASRMKIPPAEVVKKLMMMGMMVSTMHAIIGPISTLP